MQIQSLNQEDPREKEMETHSSILASDPTANPRGSLKSSSKLENPAATREKRGGFNVFAR